MLSSKNRSVNHLVILPGLLSNPFIAKEEVLDYLRQTGSFRSASLFWAVRKHRLPVIWAEEYKSYPRLNRIKNQIRDYNQQRALFWLQLKNEWLALTKILQDKNIPFIWVKGFILQECYYPEGEHRFFNDLDLLIKPEYLDETIAVLYEQGYEAPAKITSTPRHYRKSVSFRKQDTGVELELHFSLLGFFYEQWTFKRIEPFLKSLNLSDGLQVHTLPDELYLIYMAKHGSVHRWHRLFWLRDVIMVFQKTDPQLVYSAYEKMKTDNAHRCLLLMLALCNEIYQMPVDAYQSLPDTESKIVKKLVKYCLNAMRQPTILSFMLKWQKIIYYWYLFPHFRLRFKIISHILWRKVGV
ncbi:MAG: hypothetical protein GVY19_06650 [Bacteroidetes bacterium]|jgi:hypothetical protein|nr:hypothetical protein [Bacteroidota bacterium]